MQRHLWIHKAAASAALLFIVILLYIPSLNCSFIWDDDYYITHNTALNDLEGLKKIWLVPKTTPQYYPLVFTTFWVEYHIFDLNPAAFHATNIMLHAANALLVWLLLSRLGVPWAWAAAAFFAAHPVNTETVSWISERKNLLSGFFALLSFGMLMRLYISTDLKASNRLSLQTKALYITAFLFFVAALLSKSVTCVMPAVFLAIVWWKESRLPKNRLLATVPFFAAGFAAALNTMIIEKAHVGAHGFEWEFGFFERLLIAGRALWFYVFKLVFPARLVFIYPKWQIDVSSPWQWLYPVSVILILAVLWFARDQIGRGPFTGVAVFVVVLMPALGFINYFPMRFSFVADHFQYLAQIAFIALITAATHRIMGCLPVSWQNKTATAACMAALLLLGARTLQEQEKYENLYTLWSDTLAKNPSCWIAHNNLGVLLSETGHYRMASAHYLETIRLNPYYAEARYNLTIMKKRIGELGNVGSPYMGNFTIPPAFCQVFMAAGDVTAMIGKQSLAELLYKKAMNTAPEAAPPFLRLGELARGQNRLKDAILYYKKALDLEPIHVDAHRALGDIYLRLGEYEKAVEHLKTVLKIDPFSACAYHDLGTIYQGMGKPKIAAEAYRMALSINHFDKAALAELSKIASFQKQKDGKKKGK